MFARNTFPIRRASTGEEMLAGMAHAMGCGTMVDRDRSAVPVFGPSVRPAAPGRAHNARSTPVSGGGRGA